MTPRINAFKLWAVQVRGPFLVLSVLLVSIGGAAAARSGAFDVLRFALAMLGVVLAHASVNLWNEASDHRTGIDLHTQRTPFSGGSGLLQAGLTSFKAVQGAAAGTLLAALAIGVYLSWVSTWVLMIFIVCGGVASVFYTSHLARRGLGEVAAGLCLGTFVVLGTYYCQAGRLPGPVIMVSIPPGILTALLLFLNEFPDLEADRAGGRRHLVILLGRKRAAVVYILGLVVTYGILIVGAILKILPMGVLLALLTLPLACKSSVTALRHGDDFEKMVPALGANVGTVLGTDLLIAIGFLLGK